jgi:hypothetical protein
MSIYQENGYKNRKDYLNNLADDFGIDRETVFFYASVRDLEQYSESLEYQLELDNLQDDLKPVVNQLLKQL